MPASSDARLCLDKSGQSMPRLGHFFGPEQLPMPGVWGECWPLNHRILTSSFVFPHVRGSLTGRLAVCTLIRGALHCRRYISACISQQIYLG
jgi:hypothetical protein